MGTRLRVGLVGCGRIGEVHLKNLLGHPELCEVAAVVDVNQQALASISSNYRLDNTSSEVSLIFDDHTVDAVVIASSTETHARYIEELSLIHI